MNKFCGRSNRLAFIKITGLLFCRYVFILFLMLPKPLFAWQLVHSDRVDQGKIRLHYPPAQQATIQNITAHINPADGHLFKVTSQGVPFINGMQVTPDWVDAWISQGTYSAPGVYHVPLIPELPSPPPGLVAGVSQPQSMMAVTHSYPHQALMIATGLQPQYVSSPPNTGMAAMPSQLVFTPQGNMVNPVMPVAYYGPQIPPVPPTQMIPHSDSAAMAELAEKLKAEMQKYKDLSASSITRAEHDRSLRENAESHAKVLEGKNEEIEALNQQIDSLSQSLYGAVAPTQAPSQPEAMNGAEYQKALADKDKEIEEKKQEILDLQRQLQEQEQKREKELKKLSQGTSSDGALKREYDKVKQQLKEKEELLKEESQKVADRDEKLKCLECEKEAAKQSVTNAENTIGELESQLSDQKKTLDQHKAKVSDKQRKITQLETTNKRFTDKMAQNRRATKELQDKLDEMIKQQELLEAKRETNDSSGAQSEELQKLKANAEKLQKKIDATEKTLDEKNRQLKAQKQEIDAYMREANQLRAERMTIDKEHAKKLADEQKRLNQEFEEKLAGLRQQADKHKKEIESARKKHENELKEQTAQARKEGQAKSEKQLAEVRAQQKKEYDEEMARLREQAKTEKETADESANTEASTTVGNSGSIAVHSHSDSPLTVGAGGGASSPDLLASVLPKSNMPMKMFGTSCAAGGPAGAGPVADISTGGFRPDSGDSGKKKGRGKKGKRQKSSKGSSSDNEFRQDNPEQNEQEQQPEDIAPSTISGSAAEVLTSVLHVVIPYAFPVTVVVALVSSLIAYKIAQSGEPKIDKQDNLSNSSNETEPDFLRQLGQITNMCEVLGSQNKLMPLCLHMLQKPDCDKGELLTWLINITHAFPNTLTYPVFSWGYWTASGATDLNFQELIEKIESVSLGRPFDSSNLYLQTPQQKDFYLESVGKQAVVMSWLMNLKGSKSTSSLNDFILANHQQLQTKQFPLLIGVATLGNALDGKYKKLRGHLEKHQVNSLVAKLLALVIRLGENDTSAEPEQSLLIFELRKKNPLIRWGLTLNTTIEKGNEPGLLAGCSRMPIDKLKQDCFDYLVNGDIWKAKMIGSLKSYITGTLPVLNQAASLEIVATYPDIAELQRINTVDFLIGWIDRYHEYAEYSAKLRFTRSAMVLAGVYSDEFRAFYELMLEIIWLMQKEKDRLTEELWTERLLTMKRSFKRIEPEITFKPLWRVDNPKAMVMLEPEVVGEDLPGTQNGKSTVVHLSAISDKQYNLFVWVTSSKIWYRMYLDNDRKTLTRGDTVLLHCGAIYGLGAPDSQTESYLALSKDCLVRKIWSISP